MRHWSTEMSTTVPEPSPDPTPTIEYRTTEAPPPSNAGWAVATLVCFWPLAFAAFTHAFDVHPLWARGDAAGAAYASRRVRRLGQLSLWIFGVLVVLAAIAYTAVTVALIAHGDDDYGRHHMR